MFMSLAVDFLLVSDCGRALLSRQLQYEILGFHGRLTSRSHDLRVKLLHRIRLFEASEGVDAVIHALLGWVLVKKIRMLMRGLNLIANTAVTTLTAKQMQHQSSNRRRAFHFW